MHPFNDCVTKDPALWQAIWAYFLTTVNTFCTGQSIIVDGGEAINSRFVWPEQA